MRRALPVLAAVAALAGWLDFSRLQQSQHADSLVPVMLGLTGWTPFYWGQDRFGMLVPLLAIPVRAPGAHLLLQGFLDLGLSLWGLLLVVRSLLPRHVRWAPPAALLLVLLLLLPPENQRFNILWVQPYMPSFALGLAAVGLLFRRGGLRVGAAAVLLCAAAWINVAFGLVVGPLLVWRALLVETGRPGAVRLRLVLEGLVLIGLATYLSSRLSAGVDAYHTPSELLPVLEWRHAASELLRGAWREPGLRAWVQAALGLAALGSLGLSWARVRERAAPVLLAAVGLAATAAVPFLAASTSKWVALNGYSFRYLDPSLVLLQGALCLLATLPLIALPRGDEAPIMWGSALAVAVATLIAVGPPSTHAVTDAFQSRWGATARDVVAVHATHVTGDYWRVWPTVFTSAWLLGDAGRERWPYGVTDRSLTTLGRARAVRQPRVAVLDGRTSWLGLIGPHRWAIAERRPAFLLVVAAEE
ncbi:MAG TPA: hypothetical protein VK454_08335 [Myxococcaceae bacterium]|nr:hypothetical protein [Myxococcaceae bacterium]